VDQKIVLLRKWSFCFSDTLYAGTGTAWKRSEEIRSTVCGDHYKVWVHRLQLIQLLNLIDGPNWIHILNEERFPNPLPDFARLKRSISYVKHPSFRIEAKKYTYAAGCVAWQWNYDDGTVTVNIKTLPEDIVRFV
jgi:hypothetical protein